MMFAAAWTFGGVSQPSQGYPVQQPCRIDRTVQQAYLPAMSNRFGVTLHPDAQRWAAAERVSETVIAAVLLLHERRVEEVALKLSASELAQVIALVGRSPRLYPPGTLHGLESHRAGLPPQPAQTVKPSPIANKEAGLAPSARHPPRRDAPPSSRIGRDAPQSPPERAKGAEANSTPKEPKTAPLASKAGTLSGTAAETARRRLVVEDVMKAGLSVRMIAGATGIPRSSVHRAMGAVARAEARKEIAVAELTKKLLGKKLARRKRARA
jgi:hypothetical protein